MPIIHPDKSYVQTPLRIKVTEGIVIPEDWLTKLGNLVADDILKLPAQEKTIFLDKLKEKAGSNSTYTLKPQLLESLKVIYATLASPTTPASQKTAAAVKLREGAPHCTPGFHDRTNEIVISFSTPESLDELLSVQRQAIVSRAASQMTDEIHAHNRFYVVARNAGYGVRPLNPDDMYRGEISDAVITTKLTEVFAAHFTVFNVLNSLQEQLNDLVCHRGYSGRRDAGYEFADYQKFDNEFLKPFISMAAEELFLSQEDQSLIPKVLDINWWNVKQALLRNIRNERYFIFSAEEEALLDVMTRDGLSFDTLPPAAISLFPSPDELLRALMFFKEWPVEKKAGLVLYYFKHKPQQDQKAVLDKLEKIPALNAQLHVLPAMQNIYFSHAVAEGNLEKVQELVRHRPESINYILGLFIGKQKAAVMAWLDSDPPLRAVISQDALNTLITEGVHKGKTVAEVWISSKKGRQWLLADKRLQGLCPPVLAGKPLADWMQQAQAERNNISMMGLFPAINPRVMQFLQHVVHGEQAQAEAMLKNNPLLAAELQLPKGR